MMRIALTKGRLEKHTLNLFSRMGIDCTPLMEKGRRLIIELPDAGLEVVFVKASDVITYVEHGVCDLGVVGKDTILEQGRSFYEMLDLGFGKCRMMLASHRPEAFYSGYGRRKVATKFVNVARGFFAEKGMDVEIIRIEGSVELAPLLGLADGIVDIVETGTTLKENGLHIIEEICPVSARLIANLASLKLKKASIEALVDRIRANL